MPGEVLVSCNNVSKKFCKGLKRSLWYGVQDICSELNPLQASKPTTESGHLPALRKGEFWAVKDISFELRRGECLGLIGHNGAGKSTLLKMLNGLIKPDRGKITMKGRIGALIELNAGFNPILTGRENVYIYGTILGFTKQEIDSKYDAIVEFAEMQDFMEMPFRSYSSGMRVRLGFAVAAQMEPDVLIIDEVLAVGDLGFRLKCLNRIGEILQKASVIFVSHTMLQIARICSEVMMMDSGQAKLHSNDVSKAIAKYYSSFKSEKESIIDFQGKVSLKSFGILDQGDLTNVNIDFGDDLSLEMVLKIGGDVPSVTCKIFFINQELRPVLDAPSELSHPPFKQNGTDLLTIRIDIPDIKLNAGNYGLTLLVCDGKSGERIYRHDRIASINVYNKYISGSNNIASSHWFTLD